MQKVTPFLWFDKNAEEAINFYTSVFKDSKIISINRYPDGPLEGPMKGMEGKVITGIFELGGQRFMALDGGPMFKFTEAVSFLVKCEDQEEVDYFWNKLTEDGEESQCGWLKDKYGLSWQVFPTILQKLMSDPDQEKSQRVVQAFMKMKKFDIAQLLQAYNGN